MYSSDKHNEKTIKAIREKEAKEYEKALNAKCREWAFSRFGQEKVIGWSNANKGLWYLPIIDDEGEIELCLLLKPINRHILSYASTKIESEGLYIFLEACMRELFIEGDMQIIEDDEFFIPAAMKFNKIMEGKKAAILKH